MLAIDSPRTTLKAADLAKYARSAAFFEVRVYFEWMKRPDEFVPLSLEPDLVIEYYKQFIDRSLLRENRKITPTERVRKMQEMGKVDAELRRAGQKARDRADSP